MPPLTCEHIRRDARGLYREIAGEALSGSPCQLTTDGRDYCLTHLEWPPCTWQADRERFESLAKRDDEEATTAPQAAGED